MSDFEMSYVGQLRKLVGTRPLVIPGVRAVIEGPEGKILLQRRTDFGVWGVPGGSFEFGESAREVLEREILEETGLQVQYAEAFGYSSSAPTEIVTFPNGDVCHFQVLMFHVAKFGGALQHDEESLELRWETVDGAKKRKMLPNMLATIIAFEAYRATGKFQLL